MTISFFFLSVLSVSAQSIKLLNNLSSLRERADWHFQKSQYAQAANLYLNAYKKDTTQFDLAVNIAESHYRINEYKQAEEWYRKGVKSDRIEPDIWMNYAQTLIINKKYEEAKVWLRLYNGHVSEDLRAVKKLATIDNIHAHFEDSSYVKISLLNINTKNVEFGPAYFKHGIVFLSDRHSSSINNAMEWNVEDYINIYYTEEREDGSMQSPTEFHSGLNSNFHEGPMVFFRDDQIIFTRTGVQNKKTKVSHLELYSASYHADRDDWIDVSPLPFNNENYSVGHPAITSDGNTLVFSSNKPGGFGGTDLYVSTRVDGQWTEAQNLGPIINSEGQEMFPYFVNSDEMVFASDGHGGLGDLDMFRINFSDSSNLTIENLGYPYNSSSADFGYVSNATGTSGYFTSNRLHGGLDDDIYKFVTKWSRVKGLVVDKEGNTPLEQIKVELIVDGEVKETKYSDSTGMVDFISFPKEDVILEARSDGFMPIARMLSLKGSDAGKTLHFELLMEKMPKPEKEEKPKDDYAKLMELYNKQKAMIQVNGSVFEYREIGNYQYLVNADEKILLSKDAPDTELPIEERAKNAVESNGMVMEESYFIKNIYFDLNSTKISDKAKIELDKVVRIMTVDQKIAFEIISYTDSRGRMSYNDELAFRRSQEVARYLLAHDITGSRLILENYGEQGLLNDCDDSRECDEIYHAVNRRSEFKLIMRKMYH